MYKFWTLNIAFITVYVKLVKKDFMALSFVRKILLKTTSSNVQRFFMIILSTSMQMSHELKMYTPKIGYNYKF